MGREINRVPLGFDWPIGQTWLAYDVSVTFPKCWECDGCGYSPAARKLKRELTGWDTYQQIRDRLGDDALCRRCDGNGDIATEELREWREAMPDAPLPVGDGWQLWETVGDSPMSPVFATSAELVDWMTTHPWRLNPDLYGPSLVTSDRDTAERFVSVGASVGSFVIAGGRVIDGVTAAIEGI